MHSTGSSLVAGRLNEGASSPPTVRRDFSGMTELKLVKAVSEPRFVAQPHWPDKLDKSC